MHQKLQSASIFFENFAKGGGYPKVHILVHICMKGLTLKTKAGGNCKMGVKNSEWVKLEFFEETNLKSEPKNTQTNSTTFATGAALKA